MITLFLGTNSIPLQAQEQWPAQEFAETEQTLLLTDKPLEIWTFINDYRLITGRVLHVTVQIIWKLGITVNLEDIRKADLRPFTIESITIGERQIFDNEHDYLIVTYALSLPPDLKDGIYSIPSFSLSYTNEVDKTEGKAVSSPIAIRKTPILVEGKVDKDVISIGDRITYTLTIRHEKNVKLLWENIEKLNFSPFEIVSKHLEKQTKGNINKIVITYTLAMFELGEKKKVPEIPMLSILYYLENDTRYNRKTDTAAIETKEAKISPVPIVMNSLLKTVDVPLEGIKGPLYLSKKFACFYGYLPIGMGTVFLLFLGGLFVQSRAKRFSAVKPALVSETPQITRQRLKDALASFRYSSEDSENRNNIHDIDKALRIYLGTLMGISGETAQSVTTSQFLSYNTRQTLPEETSAIIQTVLKQLDLLIFGRQIDKEIMDNIVQGADEIIRKTAHLQNNWE